MCAGPINPVPVTPTPMVCLVSCLVIVSLFRGDPKGLIIAWSRIMLGCRERRTLFQPLEIVEDGCRRGRATTRYPRVDHIQQRRQRTDSTRSLDLNMIADICTHQSQIIQCCTTRCKTCGCLDPIGTRRFAEFAGGDL